MSEENSKSKYPSGRSNVPSSYIIFIKDGKVLFLMRSNTGYMDGYYGLPAGYVEDMESFTQAAIREAEEEVGIKVRQDQLRHVHTQQRVATEGKHIRVDVFFEAVTWEGELRNAEPDKHSGITWLDPANLPKNVMDYQVHVLEQIKAGNTYSEFGWSTSP